MKIMRPRFHPRNLVNTYEARAELAVINALRQLGVPTGAWANMTDVQRLWGEYGIREPDLQAAILRMVNAGRLGLFHAGACEAMTLTAAGEAWSRTQPAWLEYSLLVPRRVRTAERQRSSPERGPRPLSRRSDRSGAPPWWLKGATG
jgi:hypothetical protein